MKTSEISLQGSLPIPGGYRTVWYILPEGFVDTSGWGRVDTSTGVSSVPWGDWWSAKRLLARKDYKLYVLNEVCESLADGSVLEYNVPEAAERMAGEADGGRFAFESAKARIEAALGRAVTCPTFLEIHAGALVTLYELGEEGPEAPFCELFSETLAPAEPEIRFRILGEAKTYQRIIAPCEEIMYDDMPCDDMPGPEPAPKPQDEAELIDGIIEQLRRNRAEELRALGLTEEALRFLLGVPERKLSRLRVTRSAKIILEDYGGLEIRLDDKTKALYFLFLRHPEGICLKDLPDFVEEVADLYQSISGRDDPAAMRLTVERLCDPLANDANVSLSRIKKAFVEAFNDGLAKAYYISGPRGGVRSIPLDRALVTWETIR